MWEGKQHIRNNSPYNILMSEPSFESLKIGLSPQSGEKIDIIPEKSENFEPKISHAKTPSSMFVLPEE